MSVLYKEPAADSKRFNISFEDSFHDKEEFVLFKNGNVSRWFGKKSRVNFLTQSSNYSCVIILHNENSNNTFLTIRDASQSKDFFLKKGKNILKFNTIQNSIELEADEVITELGVEYGFIIETIYVNDCNVCDIPLKDTTETKNSDPIEVIQKGAYGEMIIKTNLNNPSGKINLNSYNQISFYSHRSGWDFVLKNLMKYNNENGVIFDGFMENTFCWRRNDNINNGVIPYKKPWVGFLHNPPNMKLWFSENNSYPQFILFDNYFRESLKHCRGIYVLSEYFKKYLMHYIPNVRINVLYHPTEIPDAKFDYQKFIANSEKKVVNIGWWQRKLYSIFLLNAKNKIRLLPNNRCKETIFRLSKIELDIENIKLTKDQINSVKMVDHLENDEYDQLLTENVVFLDLYDSSANNAIIECIARGTPILVNKHPAVIEYLGEDYPFYFDTYEEASIKLNDYDLIRKTNQYLMEYSFRKNITIETFINDFEKSEIYQNL